MQTVERDFKDPAVSRVPENLGHNPQIEGEGVKRIVLQDGQSAENCNVDQCQDPRPNPRHQTAAGHRFALSRMPYPPIGSISAHHSCQNLKTVRSTH